MSNDMACIFDATGPGSIRRYGLEGAGHGPMLLSDGPLAIGRHNKKFPAAADHGAADARAPGLVTSGIPAHLGLIPAHGGVMGHKAGITPHWTLTLTDSSAYSAGSSGLSSGRILIATSWRTLVMYTYLLLVVLTGELRGEETEIPVADEKEPFRDFCHWESFNASCPNGHVILMTSAQYGRISMGRCVESDFRIGCSADVLSHVDSRCSGRQTCTISLPDKSLSALQPCPRDLTGFLRVAYKCVPVDVGSKHSCKNTSKVALHGPAGYLSNHVAHATGRGLVGCPWKITVQPGQKINISLLDFSIWSRNKKGAMRNAKSCAVMATIMEKGVAYDIHSCHDYERVRSVFSSQTHAIEITMLDVALFTDKPYYLLKYEAVGCANLAPPVHAYMERTTDTLLVRCNSTARSWNLVCRGNTWMGELGNCSTASQVADEQKTSSVSGFPYGIMLAIGIGVILGILLGVALLMLVFACHKRRRGQTRGRGVPMRPTNALLHEPSHYGDPHEEAYKLIEIRQHKLPPGTLPPPDDPTMTTCKPGPIRAHCDHVYQTTKLESPLDGATIKLSRPDMLDCCHVGEMEVANHNHRTFAFLQDDSVRSGTLPPVSARRGTCPGQGDKNETGPGESPRGIYGTARRGMVL